MLPVPDAVRARRRVAHYEAALLRLRGLPAGLLGGQRAGGGQDLQPGVEQPVAVVQAAIHRIDAVVLAAVHERAHQPAFPSARSSPPTSGFGKLRRKECRRSCRL